MAEAARPRTGSAALIAIVCALVALIGFLWLGHGGGDFTLVIQVQPAGATVRLLEPRLENGAEVVATQGEARFAALAAGTAVKATVSATGWVQEVVQVRLPSGAGEHRVVVALKRETGLYTIRSEPPGALLHLDGKAVGVAPMVLSELVPGPHELMAHLEGYEQQTLSFEAEAGAHKEIRIVLQPAPAAALPPGDEPPAIIVSDADEIPEGWGRVVVTSSHPARFLLGNYVLGFGLSTTRNVAPGKHRVAARAEGQGTKWEIVEVEDGLLVEVGFTFDEDPIQKAMDATDPSTPIYWNIRGGNTRNEGKYGSAVEHFKRALELDPNDVTAHRQLGRTYPALKSWAEAIKHAERYLELSPGAPDADFTRELLETFRQKAAEQQQR
jgi:hypothetical protein